MSKIGRQGTGGGGGGGGGGMAAESFIYCCPSTEVGIDPDDEEKDGEEPESGRLDSKAEMKIM